MYLEMVFLVDLSNFFQKKIFFYIIKIKKFYFIYLIFINAYYTILKINICD